MPYFHSAGHDLYYRTAGSGKVAVVLVHGWYQNGLQAWSPVIDKLRKKYHLFIPDLPGHGLNPQMAGDFSTHTNDELLLAFARNLREHYRCKAVYIVGHSYGAFTVLSLAAKAAGEFEGFIALSAVDDYAPYHKRLKSVLRIPKLLTPIYYRMQALLGGFPYGDRMQLYSAMPVHLQPGKLAYAKKKNRTLPPRNSHRYMRAFLSARVHWPHEPIKTPLLLIYGARDALTPSGWAKKIQPRFKESQLHVIEGAGHNVQLSAPDEVTMHVVRFVESGLRPRSRKRDG